MIKRWLAWLGSLLLVFIFIFILGCVVSITIALLTSGSILLTLVVV
jgi:hypothetical protein